MAADPINLRLRLAAAAIASAPFGCFDPERPAEGDATSGTSVETSGESSGTSPTATNTADTTLDPTTSSESTPTTDPTTESSESSSTTGDCSTEGCACADDPDCERGLVCRDDTCQLLVCGDGLIEATEQCDDMNRRGADGCDADCTFTELLDVQVAFTRTCALIEGGVVRCWGLNDSGQLGYGNTDQIGDDETPADAGDVMLPGPAEQLTTGDGHNCVLVEGGDVICWGIGSIGQLGYANTQSIGDDEFPSTLPPVDVGAVNLQVAAGGSQSCSLGAAGTVRCWGAGFSGQLGYGTVEQVGDDETPATRPPLQFAADAVHVSCGLQHSCALFEDDTVACWGLNNQGQLGQGHVLNLGDDELATTISPIALAGVPVAITSGDNHNCVRLDDGTIRCWGANGRGQLGLGHVLPVGDDELPDAVDPVDVGAPVVRVDAGGDNTCAILEDQRLRCWGWNDFGQNGYGNTMPLGDDEVPADLPDVPLLVAP